MDEQIQRALEQDRIIDITTKGRRSGKERRIEIWFFNINGRIHITGSPGTRGWYSNIIANPDITFHLKHTVRARMPARCRPIKNREEREDVFLKIFDELDGQRDLDEWMTGSSLIEIQLDTSRVQIDN